MATENITTKYKIDISEFKAGITEANKQLKLANAEFKAATAGMDDWSKSTEGIQAKIKQLNSTVDAQKSKLAAYKGELEANEKAYTENGKRAEELKKKLADLAAQGISKTSDEYKKYEKALTNVEKEQAANAAAVDRLRVSVLNQEAAVGAAERDIRNYNRQLTELQNESEDAAKASSDLDKSIDEAAESAEDAENKFDGLASKIAKGLTVGIVALGAAAVATGKKLWDMAKDTAATGDEIDKQSQKLGVSAENYQKLSYAMERCGADVEDFRRGAVNISKTLASVQNGADEAETAIGQLGVSMKKTDGTMRSTEDVLLDTIAALADMDDEAKRNAAANEIFGRSYQELAPLLNSGADGIRELMQEAEDYGMVMSDEAVKASADFTDSMTRMSGTLNGIKNRLGAELLPPLSNLIDGFSDLAAGVEGSEAKISEGVQGIVDVVTRMVPAAVEAVTRLALELAKPENVEQLLEAGINMVAAIIDGVVQALPQLIDTVLTAFDTLLSHIPVLNTFSAWVKEHKDLVLGAVGAWIALKAAIAITNIINSVTTALSAMTGAISAQIAALKGATAAQTAANVAMAAAPYVAIAAGIAAVTAELKFYYDSLFDVSSEVKNLQEKQRDLFREIDSGKTAREIELDQLQEKADRYEQLRTKMNKTAGEEMELKELAGELQSAFGDKIQVVDSLTGEYNDLTKSVEQFIEAETRAAKMAAYKDKITELEKAIIEAEDQMAKRVEENANAGFNLFDWNGAIRTQSFMNDQQATQKLINSYKAKIDDIKGKLSEAYEEAAQDVGNTVAAGNDKMTTAALKKQGLPSYVTDMEKNIKESGEQAADAITTASDTGSETIKKAFTFATKTIGEYKNLGVVKQLGQALTEQQEEADKIASTVWQKSQEVFNRSIKNNQLSVSEQVKGWQVIRDQFVEGSDQWIAANDKVIESQQKLTEENKKSAETMAKDTKAAFESMQNDIEKLQAETDKAVEALEKEMTDLQAAYDKAVSDRASQIASQYGLFDEVPERAEKSGTDLLRALTGQVDDIEQFYKNIEKLSDRGVSEELVESIRSMGVKASGELDAILGMTDEQLQKYDAKFAEKRELSTQIAEQELQPLKEETEGRIEEIKQEITDLQADTEKQINDIKLSYMAEVATAGTDFASAFISSMSGGIQSGAKELVTNVKDAVTNAWEQAFNGQELSSLLSLTPDTNGKSAIISAIQKALDGVLKTLNEILNRIRSVEISGFKPFEGLWDKNPLTLPKLARGGVLKRGEVGLLEGTGAEAVVPLENNAAWIGAVADDMRREMKTVNIGGGMTTNDNRTTFTQNIYAPTAPSRFELYRQTKNLLALMKEGVVNV